MSDESRRKFLKTSGSVLAAGLLGGVAVKAQAEHDAHHGMVAGAPGVSAVIVPADASGICATCAFWGGKRRVMDEGKTVYGETLGWCNNPNSHHFQTLTAPQTGPMESWKKWDAV
ncbi:MAG: twin-arginine translocation signal domain-containing protein [Zoogloeaceae bacterium]|nr:twin-arginine translocation signal domain-containing protein [Zoogloeaceae bacterium]